MAGFPLTVHWSVLVILWLFTWSLADTLPQTVPGHAGSTYWIVGFSGAAALLVSLLAHEFMHAVVACRLGVAVLGVRLWVFGGTARLALLERLAEASATRAFVVESGRIVGLVTTSDVTRMIEVRGLAAAAFSR